MRELRDKVAVVTGAANGIGLSLATRFVAEGMNVVLADVVEDSLTAAVEELRNQGGTVLGVRTDVSDVDQVQALADATIKEFGAVHVLCNNAGVGGLQRFSTTSHQMWEWTLGVNLWGPINGCRVFLPLLAEVEEAHIVNTASVAGFIAGPYLHPYFVSKAGVISLSECLHAEMAIEHPSIGVSVLCPANTATGIRNDQRSAPAGLQSRSQADPGLEEMREKVNEMNEAGMSPSETAQVVVDGIRNRRLHLFTHPEWVDLVKQRMDDIISGEAAGAGIPEQGQSA